MPTRANADGHQRAPTAATRSVVEHEEAMIRAADQVVEIGPAAGEPRRLVFQGTPKEMEASPDSLTGDISPAGRNHDQRRRARSSTADLPGWLKQLKNTVEFLGRPAAW